MSQGSLMDSALASFLDLLLSVEHGFSWGPAELRAAFQWATTLQQLQEHASSASAVRQRLPVGPHACCRHCRRRRAPF